MLRNFKRGEALDFETAVRGANPCYRSGLEYKRNCQRCVVAFEMSRRGYHVVAMPNPYPQRSGTSGHPVFSGSECFGDVTKHIFKEGYTDPDLLRAAFIEHVDGFPPDSRWAVS